jgi:hypothetical protein
MSVNKLDDYMFLKELQNTTNNVKNLHFIFIFLVMFLFQQ